MVLAGSQAFYARVERWCTDAESDLASVLRALPSDGASPEACIENAVVRANVLIRVGRMSDALTVLHDARSVVGGVVPSLFHVHVLLASAKALTQLGDLSGALAQFQEGLERTRATGDRYTEALFLVNLGFFHGRLREAEAYEEYTRLALSRLREFGDRRALSVCLNNLGGAVAWQGRHAEALRCYEESLEHAVALGWRRGEALTLGGIGGVLLRANRVEDGVERYLYSIRLLNEVGDAFLVTRHTFLLGEALLAIGRASEALPHLMRAVALARDGGFELEQGIALEQESRAHEALGDHAGALRALRRQIEVEQAAVRSRNEQQIEQLKLEHRLSAARFEAESRAARNAELETLNAALTESLERQRAMAEALERLAHYDVLTGLYNRRFLTDLAERELALARRTGRSLGVVLLDVDHFKAINDRHGHAVGDTVLIRLGERLQGLLRTTDLLGRWGGEEFLVLLVDSDVAGGERAAERLCAGVAASPIPTSAGPVSVTISCGVAIGEGAGCVLEQLLRRADTGLYEAKEAGRNRWRLGASAP